MSAGPNFVRGSSVAAPRAAGVGREAERGLWRSLDYYPTPPWAARAGGELVRSLDSVATTVWEPACGAGHMASALREHRGWDVLASDIYDHGFGLVHDFLGASNPPAWSVDWIITNPPFVHAAAFARRGLEIAERGVALLVRLAFMESAGRYDLLFGGDARVTVIAPFIERVPMQLGSWDPESSTMMPYAWFVWLKGVDAPPHLRPIPPGTRKRLERGDDAQLWGGR